jgi:Family of unknown function (DUF6516)
MNNSLTLQEYEAFIYGLPQKYPSLIYSTLLIARRGVGTAVANGDAIFSGGIRLSINEQWMFDDGTWRIVRYSYEVWRGTEKLYWYDPQPHPNDPTLLSTHPHHKHIPPDIKHHRVPAPGLSFTEPNLPFLIAEIEQDLLS